MGRKKGDAKPAGRSRKVVTFSLSHEAVDRLKAASEHYTREKGESVPMSHIVEDLLVNELADRR